MLYKYSANTQFEIELLACRGKVEAVYPRLEFSLRITNPFDFHLVFINATGEISVQNPNGSLIHLGVPYFVSAQTPFRETHITPHYSTQAQLILDLDWRKLEHIEENRNRDLYLKGHIVGLCACLAKGSGGEPPVESCMWISGEIRRGNRSPFPIYQTEWTDILSTLGYGKRRIIEVLLPRPIKASSKVLDYLKVAEEAMWKGDYDIVLVSCRKAIEEIDNFLKKGGINLTDRLNSDSKAELVDTIKKKLRDFASKGAHTGSTITRRDADFVLLLTQNLVAYISAAVASPGK